MNLKCIKKLNNFTIGKTYYPQEYQKIWDFKDNKYKVYLYWIKGDNGFGTIVSGLGGYFEEV